MLCHLVGLFILVLLSKFHGLEQHVAEVSHFVAFEEGLLSWQNVPDENFITLFDVAFFEITKENVVIDRVDLGFNWSRVKELA